jgi:lantibiotic modifying enzyme
MAARDRYFENPTTRSRKVDAHGELLASLGRLTKLYPLVHTCSTGWSFHGLYSGPTSIALLFYRLSQVYPDLEFEHQSLYQWAQAYLHLGARAHERIPTPSHCGIGDETLARLALEAIISKDTGLAKQFCSYAEVVNSPTDDGSNEWLYGRAGYLYLLRLCQGVFSTDRNPGTAARLERAVRSTVNRILAVPQPWVWHGKQYLGAAHGAMSVITQVVLSMPSTAPRLQPLVLELLNHQLPSGNFPSSLPAGSDRLVQFCHGGPGFVISLRSLLPFFPEIAKKIEDAIRKAQSDIWQRGLLTKEPCLCHGIAGNSRKQISQSLSSIFAMLGYE